MTLVAFDPRDLNVTDILAFVERSQKYGLGDYRPEFGSFIPTLTFVREERKDSNATAAKKRDRRAEAANSTRAAALMPS